MHFVFIRPQSVHRARKLCLGRGGKGTSSCRPDGRLLRNQEAPGWGARDNPPGSASTGAALRPSSLNTSPWGSWTCQDLWPLRDTIFLLIKHPSPTSQSHFPPIHMQKKPLSPGRLLSPLTGSRRLRRPAMTSNGKCGCWEECSRDLARIGSHPPAPSRSPGQPARAEGHWRCA